jgi:hypothetical protein
LSLTVEAADNFFAHSCLFREVSGIDHALRQRREFFAGQSSFRIQLVSETNDADLVFGIESLDFFNDLTRSHIAKSIADEESNQSPVHDSAPNWRKLRQKRAIKVNRPYLQSNPVRSLSRLQAAHTANIFQE